MIRASLMAGMVKSLRAMQKTQVWSLGQEDPLEKEMVIHFSTLAWKIPWTEEPGRLQPMGSQRVRHDWATLLSFFLVTSYMIIKRWPWLPGLPWLRFHFVRERLWFLWVHCCFIPSLRALCPNTSVCGCPESPMLGSFNPLPHGSASATTTYLLILTTVLSTSPQKTHLLPSRNSGSEGEAPTGIMMISCDPSCQTGMDWRWRIAEQPLLLPYLMTPFGFQIQDCNSVLS